MQRGGRENKETVQGHEEEGKQGFPDFPKTSLCRKPGQRPPRYSNLTCKVAPSKATAPSSRISEISSTGRASQLTQQPGLLPSQAWRPRSREDRSRFRSHKEFLKLAALRCLHILKTWGQFFLLSSTSTAKCLSSPPWDQATSSGCEVM